MKVSDWIAEARDQGATLALGLNDRLEVKGLSLGQRAWAKLHARAIRATLALEQIHNRDREKAEERQREVEAEGRAWAERRKHEADKVVMAQWDWDKVERLAAEGRLTAADVRLWREARDELQRELALRVFGAIVASRAGCTVTINER